MDVPENTYFGWVQWVFGILIAFVTALAGLLWHTKLDSDAVDVIVDRAVNRAIDQDEERDSLQYQNILDNIEQSDKTRVEIRAQITGDLLSIKLRLEDVDKKLDNIGALLPVLEYRIKQVEAARDEIRTYILKDRFSKPE